ncbi:AAA family ATPase [Epilithonimonas zeae]|uniref:ATPase family associated with various cellular activities (AAA) n=1 Tax=Epilithonimonas zeae TaxID=1416779 RepID=A0A1N6G0I2_9FLAO|nr:ATP-binding protein [Epilithonimonas zeae]SIO00980.1 ATPase family associated with various cellular activities (AAA) [Epilithonimonas zeae]
MSIFDLIIDDKEKIRLDDISLNDDNRRVCMQIMKENFYSEELSRYGLPVSNKILLHGTSGCGKTMTAKAMACELNKKILILNLSNVVCSRIGETSQNMRQIFEKAGREKAVLFLDEFDQIGKSRGSDDKDVGEMRRLVNTIIQLIDYFPQNALLICATNHTDIIDAALLRRFQIKLKYELPEKEILDNYYDRILSVFPENVRQITRQYDISFAEAKDHTYTTVKSMLINKWDQNEKEEEICTTK